MIGLPRKCCNWGDAIAGCWEKPAGASIQQGFRRGARSDAHRASRHANRDFRDQFPLRTIKCARESCRHVTPHALYGAAPDTNQARDLQNAFAGSQLVPDLLLDFR